MKILVTGCAGFIGFHILKHILDCGHEVVGVDDLNEYYSPQLKYDRLAQFDIDAKNVEAGSIQKSSQFNFSFIRMKIEDGDLYEKYLNNLSFDLVCHLAAQAGVRYSIENPRQYISSNIQGFFAILEYCRFHPVKHLVFASSSSVYGKNSAIPYRESDKTDSPVSLYAATKKSNELFAHSYCELYGIKATGLRFFTVYGPWGRPDMAPFIFTHSILEDKPINVYNNGDMMRDFTYIDDIVEGTYKVLVSDNCGDEKFRIYNIGNSKPVHIGDFISTIERISGKMAQRNLLPMQAGDVKETWADVSLLKRDFNYSPHTTIEEGMKQFINWYKNYYKK